MLLTAMSRRRWIADEVHGNRAALTGHNAEHLARVLRARIGQKFEVAANGRIYLATIAAFPNDRVEFDLGEELPADQWLDITLLLAIFKFDRLEWAIEKCTELGVARIIPVIARRTESHLAQAAANRSQRWRRIAHEAAQQSRRTAAPEIASPCKLKEALAASSAVRIVLAETEKQMSLKQALSRATTCDDIALAVGPEGGWTGEELALFSSSDWLSASLGPNILRAETAAMAAMAITASELVSRSPAPATSHAALPNS